jgi:hypothetical protein
MKIIFNRNNFTFKDLYQTLKVAKVKDKRKSYKSYLACAKIEKDTITATDGCRIHRYTNGTLLGYEAGLYEILKLTTKEIILITADKKLDTLAYDYHQLFPWEEVILEKNRIPVETTDAFLKKLTVTLRAMDDDRSINPDFFRQAHDFIDQAKIYKLGDLLLFFDEGKEALVMGVRI